MCEWGNKTVVTIPDGINPEKRNRIIAVDACIAETIQALWREGCQTLGCCCGHGRENPSVVVSPDYDDDGISRIAEFLRNNDPRPWTVQQWRLVTVAMTLPVSRPGPGS